MPSEEPEKSGDETDENNEDDEDDGPGGGPLNAAVTVDNGTATVSAFLVESSLDTEGANVTVNGEFVGTTDADGELSFDIPEDADELDILVEYQEFETELEYEFNNNDNGDDKNDASTSSSTDGVSRFDRFLRGGSATGDSGESSDPDSRSVSSRFGGDRTDSSQTSQDDSRSTALDVNSIADRFDQGSQDSESPVADWSRSEQTDNPLGSLLEQLTQLDSVTQSSQVLVLSPLRHGVTDRTCTQFFDAGVSSEKNYLFVTIEDPAKERLEICQDLSRHGGETGVIEVGRATTDPSSTDVPEELAGRPVTFKSVNSPQNLSKLGIIVSKLLSEWDNNDNPTILCFSSLTELLEYNSSEKTWKFLHISVSQLSSSSVSGHFHMDIRGHSNQTIQKFKELFDLTLTVSANGDVDID